MYKPHSTLSASTTDFPVLQYRLLYTRTHWTSCWHMILTVPPTQTDGLNAYINVCDKLNSLQRHLSGYCLTKVSPTFGIRMFRELVCYITDTLLLLIFNSAKTKPQCSVHLCNIQNVQRSISSAKSRLFFMCRWSPKSGLGRLILGF